MAKHIHIHLPVRKTRDAGTAHDPSNGQFTSGQHSSAAAAHKAKAAEHKAKSSADPGPANQGGINFQSGHSRAARLHSDAAEAHEIAAAQVKAGTPHAAHYAKNAHSMSQGAQAASAKLHGQGPAAGKGPKPPDVVGVVSNPDFYKHQKRLPVGSHVIHSAGAYAGKVVGHEGEHVHVEKEGQTRKLLGGMLRPDSARHIDPKSAANAYKGTHAGPLHIGSTKV